MDGSTWAGAPSVRKMLDGEKASEAVLAFLWDMKVRCIVSLAPPEEEKEEAEDVNEEEGGPGPPQEEEGE